MVKKQKLLVVSKNRNKEISFEKQKQKLKNQIHSKLQ